MKKGVESQVEPSVGITGMRTREDGTAPSIAPEMPIETRLLPFTLCTPTLAVFHDVIGFDELVFRANAPWTIVPGLSLYRCTSATGRDGFPFTKSLGDWHR